MSKINRASGINDFDKIGDLDEDIASLEWRISVEEALRSAPVAPPAVSKRRRAPTAVGSAD
jgi:hypothetical protein